MLWLTLLLPAAATLAGIGTYTRVLGPEDPPRPSRADMAGRYEDGHGGEVTLRADGTAVVSGIEYTAYEDASVKRCEGTGTWPFEETLPRWHHKVRVFTACGYFQPWDVDGPPSAPRMTHWTEPGYPGGSRVLTRR
ncbi:hypothetical protein [Streptomyces roseolus]|uniref:hypothetical protein n=1 Tax=Streptomyces roseolus TaxID=67358 RepID=UPI00167896FE|nr:hypothetical protein [Streptomyces roseolus]GGR40030.1 hypothetical protein GCM10010282_35940 [Streptomyces roseolus]